MFSKSSLPYDNSIPRVKCATTAIFGQTDLRCILGYQTLQAQITSDHSNLNISTGVSGSPGSRTGYTKLLIGYAQEMKSQLGLRVGGARPTCVTHGGYAD